MRSNDAATLSDEETTSGPPRITLPHLKGGRPTIHAGLLRPVLLNRTSILGHPGGPPPAYTGKKRRKKHKGRQKMWCAVTGPHVYDSCGNPHQESSTRMCNGEQLEEYPNSRVRSRMDSNNAKHGNSNEFCKPTSQRTFRSRCGSPAISPASASGMRTSSMMSSSPTCDLDRQHGSKVTGATDQGCKRAHYTEYAAHPGSINISQKGCARRLQRAGDMPLSPENAFSAQPRTDAGLDPADLASALPSGSKRRSSVLTFRPATRQEVNRPNSQNRTTINPTTQKTTAETTAKVLDKASSSSAPDGARGYLGEVDRLPLGDCPRDSRDNHARRAQHGTGRHIDHDSTGTTNQSRISRDSGGRRKKICGTNNNNESFNNGNNGDGHNQSSNSKLGARAGRHGDESVRRERVSRFRSPVETTLCHVAQCMCEGCRRGRAKRGLGSPAPPTFKFVGVEPKLVSATLRAQRFRRYRQGSVTHWGARASWRLLWSSQHLRSHVFRNLKRGQRINSFPRTYECTRKDTLSRNMSRMRQVHGARHFSFAPPGFVLPAEREAVRKAMLDTSEGQAWIVKPASSACGRGIYITNKFADMPVGAGPEGNWVAQRYIEDPLLLDGLKFDLRLYVAVTSFRPLRVYMYREGLCRLATEIYNPDSKTFGNRFIHLTNYSINRRSSRYEPATTGEYGKDEHQDLRKTTGDSMDHSPERRVTDADGMSSTPQRKISTNTDSGRSKKRSENEDKIDLKESVAATPCGSATERKTRDDNITAGGGKCGRGGGPTTSADTAAPTNGKGGDERADDGGGYPVGEEDHETLRRPQTTDKSSSRSCSWGVRGGKGSKWSLKALRKSLAEMGVNVPALWEDIHSVVIKTLIAIEGQVSAAVELLAIRRGTCFELFGFDVLVDQERKPHLLEVNFAPSLNTDSDLDLDIKSKVVSDLLTLAGIRGNPEIQRIQSSRTATINTSTLDGRKNRREDTRRHEDAQTRRTPVSAEATGGGNSEVDDSDEGDMKVCNHERVTAATVEGRSAIVAPGKDSTPGKNCGLRRGSTVDGREKREREGEMRARQGIENFRLKSNLGDQAARPATKGSDRERPICHANNRQRKRIDGGGGDGNTTAGPAWEGSFREGDGGGPSAEEMAAVAMDSKNELRRSGGFDLIFPLASTVNKYLKFFDSPRPLERMLAATSASTSPDEAVSTIYKKALGSGARGRCGRRGIV